MLARVSVARDSLAKHRRSRPLDGGSDHALLSLFQQDRLFVQVLRTVRIMLQALHRFWR